MKQTEKSFDRVIEESAQRLRRLGAQVNCIGRTAGGRELLCAHFGGPDSVLFVAGTHPVEYITSLLLCEWLERLCRAAQSKKTFFGFDAAAAFSSRGIDALLCHNPDGCGIVYGGPLTRYERDALEDLAGGEREIFNCNLGGIDLNRNFPAGWERVKRLCAEEGTDYPRYAKYCGCSPADAPETRALTDLCERKYFRHALTLHSQGEQIFWRYGDKDPEYAEIMAHILALSCGYTVMPDNGAALAGGFKDWFIERFGRPAFTLEIGRGKNPLPRSELPALYKKTAKTLLIAALM